MAISDNDRKILPGRHYATNKDTPAEMSTRVVEIIRFGGGYTVKHVRKGYVMTSTPLSVFLLRYPYELEEL